MMTYSTWILFSLVFITLEICIPSFFFFFCLTIGALFAGLFSFYFKSFYNIDLIFFFIGSFASLYLIKPIFKMIMKSKFTHLRSNVDALINSKARVITTITPTDVGLVKVSNEIWRAKSNVEITVGETVIIASIDGTTLSVYKIH
ncbi:MAG: NfeD family protein [Endomicrobium sp.]|nr:NfeD family protein [Endomicrobium sp.]